MDQKKGFLTFFYEHITSSLLNETDDEIQPLRISLAGPGRERVFHPTAYAGIP